ncbi:MAG: inositol phosphorylceramide synthase [Proteobacteria bacterium]|nr:inositol phosphorylceramide synthase [Pseudomonadota bacterium]
MICKIIPDKKHLLSFSKATLVNFLIFFAVYPTLNSYSDGRELNRMYFTWEISIPLIDWMILPYLSMNLFFLVPLFFIRTKKISQLSMACIISTISAGLIFYFYPCQLGFIREVPQNFSILYRGLFAVDRPFNLFPSLHITYPILFVIFCRKNFGIISRVLVFLWLILVTMSIVLTHQHQVLDVVAGILLALVSYKISKKLFQISEEISGSEYIKKILSLSLEGSELKECDYRLVMLTGQSSFVSSVLDDNKRVFLQKIAANNENFNTSFGGFPWNYEFNTRKKKASFAMSCVRNAMQYLWLKNNTKYQEGVRRIIHHAIQITNQQLVFITGSCGIQHILCALKKYQKTNFCYIKIIALGPVGENIMINLDLYDLHIVQGKRDFWSKILWNGKKANYRPDCGHLEYYECPEVFTLVDKLIKQTQN